MTQQHFTKPTFALPANQKTAYINARLMNPETGLDAVGGLLTEGSTIAEFGEGLFANGDVPEGAEIIDCGGNVLCPGLLDIQVHFREPGQEHKETIETGSKSAAAGGVTTVVCQPNTSPVIDNEAIMAFVEKRARETAYCDVKAYACISKGMLGRRAYRNGPTC